MDKLIQPIILNMLKWININLNKTTTPETLK